MTKSTYRGLIDGLCKLTGIEQSEEFYEKAELDVDGIKFILGHGGEANENGLIMCCNYGKPPVALLPVVAARLLEANLQRFAPGGLRFGIDLATYEVLLAGVLPMTDMTASGLADLLEFFAEQAHEWRDHYFVLPPSELRPAAEWEIDLSTEEGSPA